MKDHNTIRTALMILTAFTPVARLGYRDYTFVREVVELRRPDEG